MKISIVTPSFNQADYLERTLRSVLDQEGDFELEYLVFDGGSTDGSIDLLKRFGDQLRWTSEPDEGQIDAVNKGLRRVSGDIVAWVNSDDLLLPGCLNAVAEHFQTHPTTNWLHGGCIVIDESDQEIRKFVTRYKRKQALRYSFNRLLVCNFISQMAVFWRRDLMDEVGYLSTDYPLAFDYDYWLRMGKMSDPDYLDQNLAAFRWYPQSKSGANVDEQFRENLQIAHQHGLREHGMELRKRINHLATVTAYKAMALIR